MPHAIVVLCKEPKDAKETCFVALPFEGFDEVYHAIADAAVTAGLLPVRVDHVQQQTTFPADILEGIRSAKVVVAVCAPDQRAGDRPNVNVVYELGLAHALGKPTIILATQAGATLKETVPANLVDRHLLVYQPNDVANGSLAARLEARILQLLRRMRDGGQRILTDPAEEAASESGHWAFVYTDAWKPFLEVIRFAKRVHNVFQDFEVFLAGMRRDVEDIVRKPEIGLADELAIAHKWEAISKQYRAVPKRDLLGALPATLTRVEECFDHLVSEAGSAAGALSECRKHYWNLKQKFADYQPLTHQLEETSSRHKPVSPRPEESARELLGLLMGLSDQTTSLAVEADILLLNLIDVLAETAS